MANVGAFDHEENSFDDWGGGFPAIHASYPLDGPSHNLAKAAFKVVTDSLDVDRGLYVVEVDKTYFEDWASIPGLTAPYYVTSSNPYHMVGPVALLPEPLTEIFASVYVNVTSIGVPQPSVFGTNYKGSDPLVFYSAEHPVPADLYQGSVGEFALSVNPTGSPPWWYPNLGSISNMGGGYGGVSGDGVNLNTWAKVDVHIKTNYPALGFTISIRTNCGTENSITDTTHLMYPMTHVGMSISGVHFKADNVVLNDVHGTRLNTWPCTAAFPGAAWNGEDGATISPAPEKLPHVITLEDAGGNQSFQRKLQENFDTIERQLLALDPDNQGNKDPNR